MTDRLRDNPDEPDALVAQAAAALGIPAAYVEKDFWVTEVLRAARRADTMVSTTLPAAQELLDDVEVDYALSGSTAAVHYLGGRNTVADLGRRIVYTTRTLSQADFPVGDEVIILTEDPEPAAGTGSAPATSSSSSRKGRSM